MSKRVKFIIVILSTVILISCVYLISIYNKTIYTAEKDVVFEIPSGSSVNKMVNVLNKKGIDVDKFQFKLVIKLSGLDSKLQSGYFKIRQGREFSVYELAQFLTKGGSYTIDVTIPEGKRIKEIASIMKNKVKIDSAKFVNLTNDKKFIESLGFKLSSLEGYLYPETYNFNVGSSPEKIIKKMVNRFNKMISQVKSDLSKSKYSLHEIITLSSIIQGEVMVRDEAYLISAVYNNRLKKKMKLQADPTIQYLLDKPRRLYNKHLKIDSPYNTYMYRGLPPGPINNPSIEIIKAALNPADKSYIFMVAKGNGEHYFNSTLKDHLKDKEKFDRVRRKYKKK